MSETPKYDLNNAKIGGGFAGDEGTQTGGTLNDYSSHTDYSSKQGLAEAAAEIQQLLTNLQAQGYNQEDAKEQAAQDLVQKAQSDPKVLDKLIKWGQSLGDTAAKSTLTTAVTAVVKLALKLLGVPLL